MLPPEGDGLLESEDTASSIETHIMFGWKPVDTKGLIWDPSNAFYQGYKQFYKQIDLEKVGKIIKSDPLCQFS